MVDGEGDDRQNWLIIPSNSSSSDLDTPLLDSRQKTGSLWTAMAMIITGVLGAGVLSLAWSMEQLGWIGGPFAILFFAAITVCSTSLVSDLYRSPHPEHGTTTYSSYTTAVGFYIGKKNARMCGLIVKASMYGSAIAYTITSAASFRAIKKSNCYHKKGHNASCEYGESFYMVLFGGIQIIVSQIPDFHNMEWLSVIAALMSFAYAFIGVALGFAKVIGNEVIKGSIGGVSTSTRIQKLWLIFQALGDIAFAYPYTIIVLEIQDTLKAPPAENKTMKKASKFAILITTIFYLCCGCFGYAAFGDSTPGNLLSGFGFYEPYWLIDFANACIILHLVGGYQVYSQPIFTCVEHWMAKNFPRNGFVNNFHTLKPPFLPSFRLNLLRLSFRTIYVVTTTAIAMAFPYFNQFLGVLGAFGFWPLAIYFPVEMYLVQNKVRKWTRKWILFQIFSLVCLVVSMLAIVGSIEGLVTLKLG